MARDILEAVGARLAPHQRITALEFADLPKTASGKIRRAQLREAEKRAAAAGGRAGRPTRLRSEELLGEAVGAAPGL